MQGASLPRVGTWLGKPRKNEGSSGDVDENKEKQVSGVGCQVSGARRPGYSVSHYARLAWRTVQNEGASGYIDENKEGQISGVGGLVSGAACKAPAFRVWALGSANHAKMKVHPAISMKTKKGRFQVSEASCQELDAAREPSACGHLARQTTQK
jgi:hypothetical protein